MEGEAAVAEMLASLVGFGVLICKEIQGTEEINSELIVTRKDVGIEEDEYGVYFDGLPSHQKVAWAIRKELLRLTTLVLGLACRDLQKGALLPGERFTEVARHTEEFYSLCRMTGAEKLALKACNGAIEASGISGGSGEFRTELVISWISNMLRDAVEAQTLDEAAQEPMLGCLESFKQAYFQARALSYNEAPYQYTHMFVLLVCIFCFSVPFALVASFGSAVWVPTVVISIAFFGMYEISKDMEKPFGFDHGDIKVESMVQLLNDKNTATMRLALSGQFQNRPASTATDILSTLLKKTSSVPSIASFVPQYSLCRLPSIISNKSTSHPVSHQPTPPTTSPPDSGHSNFVFSLNEKTRSSVTSDEEKISRVSSNTSNDNVQSDNKMLQPE